MSDNKTILYCVLALCFTAVIMMGIGNDSLVEREKVKAASITSVLLLGGSVEMSGKR